MKAAKNVQNFWIRTVDKPLQGEPSVEETDQQKIGQIDHPDVEQQHVGSVDVLLAPKRKHTRDVEDLI